jgi:hypothetical protein
MQTEESGAAIRNELQPGERLLWSGRPDPIRGMLPTFAIWLFAIPWTCFAVFWIVTAYGIGSHANNSGGGGFAFFPLFGLPFVLVGIGMFSSPYFVYLKLKRTAYGITDKRAIIISGKNTKTVDSYDSSNVGHIQRTERADRSGTLYFAQTVTNNGKNGPQTTNIGFVGIPEVRNVEQILRETLGSGNDNDSGRYNRDVQR